jgi:serine/threonine-protein kinase
VSTGDGESRTGPKGRGDATAEPTLVDGLASVSVASPPDVVDPIVGTTINGYVVKGRLGLGGMGIVYEGEQPLIGKRVAIKVLRPEIAENPQAVERLVSEARAVNTVGHRGIVDVFGLGALPDGRQCIVMEYLDGESLEALLSRTRRDHRVLSIYEVLTILEEVLSALGAAHRAGVVHRDLKPSNVYLCTQRDGTRFVKLLDFGIARLGVLGTTPQTRASMMLGTPSYMAPEQVRGGPVSPAIDLYALGVITYEMLTGSLPFTGASVVEVLTAHLEKKPAAPSTLMMSIPDDLDELVLRLLEKQPSDRYETAEAVRVEVLRLRRLLADPTASRTEPDLGPAETLMRATPRRVAEAALAEAVAPVREVPLGAPESSVVLSPSMQHLAAATPPRAAPKRSAAAEETILKRPAELDELLPPLRSKTPLVVAALVGLVLAGATIWALLPSSEPAVAVAPARPPVVAPSPPPPAVVAAPPSVEPAAVPTPAPAAVVVAAPPTAAAPVPVAVSSPPVAAPPPPVAAAPAVPMRPAVVAVTRPPAVAAVVAPRPTPAPTKDRMAARLDALEGRLQKARASGVDTGLFDKQVARVRARLAQGGLNADDREKVDVLLGRLEGSTDY